MTQRSRDSAVKSADLAMEAGRIAARDKRHGDAAALFQEAADKYEQAKDDEGSMKAKSLLARQLALTPGSVKQALLTADDCQRLCKSISSTGMFLGAVYNTIGLAYMDCRAYPSATAAFLNALPYYKDVHWTMEATINLNLGCAYYCRLDFENARRFHQASADIYLQHENDARAAQGFVNVALCYAKLKRHDMARAAYEKSLSAAHRCGSRAEEWQALQGLATSYSAEGQLEKAVQYYKQAFVACSLPSEGVDNVNDYVKDRLFKSLSQAILRCHSHTTDQQHISDEGSDDAAAVGGAGSAEAAEEPTVSSNYEDNKNESLEKSTSDNSAGSSITEVTESDAQSGSSVSGAANSDDERDVQVMAEQMRRFSEGNQRLDNSYTPFERTDRGVQSPLPQDLANKEGIAESPRGMDSGDIGSRDSPSESETDESSGETLSDSEEPETSERHPKMEATKPAPNETYIDPTPKGVNYFREASRTMSAELDNTYMTIDHIITGEFDSSIPSTSADARGPATQTPLTSPGKEDATAAVAKTTSQDSPARQKSRACILL